jgi:hypothetical protein|tara:strand:+ start:718 stop:873 length:156 start_codon:yes stop_codon:yes gene_type:complete
MPLPTKKDKETKSRFVSRCIADLTSKKEFKDIKQRIAVCISQWDKKDENAS